MTQPLRTILDGLSFPEGPRWRDGRLFFSDFYRHRVIAVTPEGAAETVCEVPQQPSGLGWLPDGRLLVVSMADRRLLRLDDDGLTEVANVSDLAPSHCNDMVVDSRGRAYIGNFGFNRRDGEEPRSTTLVRVDPDGHKEIVADDLWFPNGSVITPDGSTLVVAETQGSRLTAWDILPDGKLSGRRVWADLGEGIPDGICLDTEGAIWVADPRNRETFRVREGGEVTHRISTGDHGSFACMLGGEDGRTLFLCTASTSGPETAELLDGRIQATEVEVPHAGLP